MADRNNNKGSKQQQQQKDGTSTISYLPILFANGYPIALEKMTEEQLEHFIPFLVKCSLNLKNNEEPKTAPKWWPAEIEFSVPFEKPKDFKDDWKKAMKNLVTECYDHHKQPFLLRYSKELSKNDTANLRYVKDSDTTTALWSRNPEKLLLTFRNDLMLYDRKKRRQLWKKDERVSESEEAESAFDIFLCDLCDATFVSEEAYQEHEKKCNQPEGEEDSSQAIENIVISDDEDDEEELEEEEVSIQPITGQTDFMAYFYLASTDADELPHRNNSFLERSLSPKKKKKHSRNTRKTITQKDREREFSIPFSSPAGMVLTSTKKSLDEDYIMDKLDEIENYCQAKPTTKVSRAKVRFPQNNTEKTLMRQMRKIRPYYWPRKTLHSRTRERNFEFLNRWLIEDCKPFNIILEKLTNEDIKSYKERLIRLKEAKERANCVDLISDSDSESVEVDDEVNEAMTKLNGQFLLTPATTTTTTTPPVILPKYSEYLSIPASQQKLANGDIKFTRQTTTTTTIIQQSFQTNVNTYHNGDNEIIERHHVQQHSSSTKSIHEWLNNVNLSENFQITNQLSLINS